MSNIRHLPFIYFNSNTHITINLHLLIKTNVNLPNYSNYLIIIKVLDVMKLKKQIIILSRKCITWENKEKMGNKNIS